MVGCEAVGCAVHGGEEDFLIEEGNLTVTAPHFGPVKTTWHLAKEDGRARDSVVDNRAMEVKLAGEKGEVEVAGESVAVAEAKVAVVEKKIAVVEEKMAVVVEKVVVAEKRVVSAMKEKEVAENSGAVAEERLASAMREKKEARLKVAAVERKVELAVRNRMEAVVVAVEMTVMIGELRQEMERTRKEFTGNKRIAKELDDLPRVGETGENSGVVGRKGILVALGKVVVVEGTKKKRRSMGK
ncbi:hypothetical protein C7212DRAFT_347567 [Tuber magnatum]|uniref:Uncharacterized protein n=1 Tax=Tuber magnatum TaxID=42249 RepID=A0A317SI43_9PEZI|nr:hypothetical protein C7212DRAFT_347567 [Tuber magnatum]